MIDPNNRVVMISGANRGIGLAIARIFIKQDFPLVWGLEKFPLWII